MDFYSVNLVDPSVENCSEAKFRNEKFNHVAGAVLAYRPHPGTVREVYFDLNIGKFFNLDSSESSSVCNGKRYHRMTSEVESEMRKAIEYPYLTSNKRERMNVVLEILKEIGEL